MHRDLRMRKAIQANISSVEFISITTNTKFTKGVRYIHENKSWERCHVLLNIFFLVLESFAWQIVILQEWTNFITIRELPRSALRRQYLILIIRDCSLTYCHNPIYGTSHMTKEESISNDCNLYSDNIFFISSLWN